MSYSTIPAALGYGTATATFPINVGSSGTDYYQVTVVTPDTVTQGGAANTYLITATPIAGTSAGGRHDLRQLERKPARPADLYRNGHGGDVLG